MEDFSVITALGRVDSHVKREFEGGLPGAVWRADARQQCTVPGAKEGGRGRLSDREKWRRDRKEPGLERTSCPEASVQHPRRISLPTIVALEVPEFGQLRSDGCVLRDGCVRLAVCCLMLCGGCEHICVQCPSLQILLCAFATMEVKPFE